MKLVCIVGAAVLLLQQRCGASAAGEGRTRYRAVAGALPDDVAYRLARTLHGVEGAFCKKLPQACETTAVNPVAAASDVALIHPGVMKYFREIGIAK